MDVENQRVLMGPSGAVSHLVFKQDSDNEIFDVTDEESSRATL